VQAAAAPSKVGSTLPYRWGTFLAYVHMILAALCFLVTFALAESGDLFFSWKVAVLSMLIIAYLGFVGYGLLHRYRWSLYLLFGMMMLFLSSAIGNLAHDAGPQVFGFGLFGSVTFTCLNASYYWKRRFMFTRRKE
jgi:hypothetical protein